MVADEWIDRSSDMHACLRYLNGINQFIYHNPVELDPSSIKKITFLNCAIWRSEFNITQYWIPQISFKRYLNLILIWTRFFLYTKKSKELFSLWSLTLSIMLALIGQFSILCIVEHYDILPFFHALFLIYFSPWFFLFVHRPLLCGGCRVHPGFLQWVQGRVNPPPLIHCGDEQCGPFPTSTPNTIPWFLIRYTTSLSVYHPSSPPSQMTRREGPMCSVPSS